MKLSHIIFSSATFTCFIASLFAVTYNISDDPASNEKRKSLSVTTNDVVLIKAMSGAVAVVQFTSFGPDIAAYHWRYRPAKSQPISSGNSQVRESYDCKPYADGGRVIPKADHDTTIRAGDFRMEWSQGSTTNGWLYYHPNRAAIQILDSSAFDRDF